MRYLFIKKLNAKYEFDAQIILGRCRYLYIYVYVFFCIQIVYAYTKSKCKKLTYRSYIIKNVQYYFIVPINRSLNSYIIINYSHELKSSCIDILRFKYRQVLKINVLRCTVITILYILRF